MTVQLTSTNTSGSVIHALENTKESSFSFAAFGSTASRNGSASLLPQFAGERPDPLTQVLHLGCGYRAYSSTLMRFTCPDSESPFGSGGINPYVYCSHDPINQTDPSGHGLGVWITLGIQKLLRLGIAEEAAAGAATGISETATSSVMASFSEVAADATGQPKNLPGKGRPAGFAKPTRPQGSYKGPNGYPFTQYSNSDYDFFALSAETHLNTETGRTFTVRRGVAIPKDARKHGPIILTHGAEDGRSIGYYPGLTDMTDHSDHPYISFTADEFVAFLNQIDARLSRGISGARPGKLVACYAQDGRFVKRLVELTGMPWDVVGKGGVVAELGIDEVAKVGLKNTVIPDEITDYYRVDGQDFETQTPNPDYGSDARVVRYYPKRR